MTARFSLLSLEGVSLCTDAATACHKDACQAAHWASLLYFWLNMTQRGCPFRGETKQQQKNGGLLLNTYLNAVIHKITHTCRHTSAARKHACGASREGPGTHSFSSMRSLHMCSVHTEGCLYNHRQAGEKWKMAAVQPTWVCKRRLIPIPRLRPNPWLISSVKMFTQISCSEIPACSLLIHRCKNTILWSWDSILLTMKSWVCCVIITSQVSQRTMIVNLQRGKLYLTVSDSANCFT